MDVGLSPEGEREAYEARDTLQAAQIGTYLVHIAIVIISGSTHRVAIDDLWRTSHYDGKVSPGWWGWGMQAHPLSAYYHHVQSCSVRSCWVGRRQRYTHPVSSLPIQYIGDFFFVPIYVLCGYNDKILWVYLFKMVQMRDLLSAHFICYYLAMRNRNQWLCIK